MRLLKYKVPCVECQEDKIFWAEEDNLVCPVNATHTLTISETQILKKCGDVPIFSEHDKMEVIAESRPPGTITVFTSAGDSASIIGDGVKLLWNASDSNNIHPSPPIGMKGKLFDLTFLDDVWIKEGAIYHLNAQHGSWCRMSSCAPAGYPYQKNDGSIVVATEITPFMQFIPLHFFAGDVPMGDELNTEGCTREPLPKGYIVRIEVFVPESDTLSSGHITLEMYRNRTIIMPGEAP